MHPIILINDIKMNIRLSHTGLFASLYDLKKILDWIDAMLVHQIDNGLQLHSYYRVIYFLLVKKSQKKLALKNIERYFDNPSNISIHLCKFLDIFFLKSLTMN